jgi:adenosylmethionine-8-amino-7-oxononanoate aminotransferase
VLAPLADHPLVAAVRAGTGLLGAVELDAGALAGGLGTPQLTVEMRRHGVLARPLGTAVAVSPPLTIQHAELELIGSAIRASLDALLDRTSQLAGRAA